MAISNAIQGSTIGIFRHLHSETGVLESLVAGFTWKGFFFVLFGRRKSLVELRTEFVVVSGAIISRNSFVTFQTSATRKIVYPFHNNSRICFELRVLATIYDLPQWTSGASQKSSVSRILQNKFKVPKNETWFISRRDYDMV